MKKQFKNILIDKTATAKDAIKQLDRNLEKILFVVDESNKLIGSVTDGDIRRWILKDGDLSIEVDKVCFKGTFFVQHDYNIDNIKREIRKREISYVPVVNDDHIIVEFLTWDNLFDKKIIRKIKNKIDAAVVIMAGGKGTRLDPFTKILPKPLIPIGDKTILEVIIEKFTAYQQDEFYISVNHKAKIIKSYFEEIQPSYKIKYIDEEKPLGTIGALKKIDGEIKKNMILTNCDIIIEADYTDILEHHIKEKNDITIVASLKHYNIPYGICEIENGGILIDIKEKPEYDLLVNTGMYVLKPEVLKHIPKDEFFHITHLIEKIKSTHKIGIYPISENSWIDIGEMTEYKKALNKLL
ncbi:MAG: nucleotidyltransferase family protein [Melioribacteraceae bacterium]|jgi:dTDP-glucose pyrophosphorylase|nr:MAG: nucleotidyltransferase family protein [Melioribacteraceae bacterium]